MSSKPNYNLSGLFSQFEQALQDQILELIPEAEPKIDVKRIKQYSRNDSPRISDVLAFIKSQLSLGKGQIGGQRENFRTAKNLVLVLLVIARPETERVFSGDKDYNADQLEPNSSISLNTRKNAIGYYGTERWEENVKFMLGLLGAKSAYTSPSRSRPSSSGVSTLSGSKPKG